MTHAAHIPAFESWRPPAARLAGVALAAGVILLGVCAGAGFLYPAQAFQAYLYGFLFWWMASMGCVGLALLHNLTGGVWGAAIRPFLHAGIATVLLCAVLFIPLAFGVGQIYEWARFERYDEILRQDDPILYEKVNFYLYRWFVLGRVPLYFVIWLAAAAIARSRARRPSAVSLALLILAVTFAAIDWAMSLDTHWFSTMYGALYVAGGAIEAMAISIVFLGSLVAANPPFDRRTADVLNDLGNFLLAFVMLWAYFSFSQFLIIWSGNLPEETVWYLARAQSPWQWVAAGIALLHFAVPFLLLLSRDIKRSPATIVAVAGGLILMRAIDLLWLVAPSFHDHGWGAIVLDFLALAGIGGLWLAVFSWSLKSPAELAAAQHGKPGGRRKGGAS